MASTKDPKGPSTSGSTSAPSSKLQNVQNKQQNPKQQQQQRKQQQQQKQQRPAGDAAATTPASSTPAKKNPKDMTKAERRELQERQRAAKAAAAANAGGGGSSGGGAGASGKGHARTASTAGGSGPGSQTPSRRSQGGAPPDTPSRPHALSHSGADDALQDAQTRGLRIFSHFGVPKPPSSKAEDRRAIHPAIIRLGLLFSGFKITGANARCIATLTAFKTVIQDYSTPLNTTLSRHLMSHLNPQINHLVSARPMAVTMGNAIRQLKLDISKIDIDMPEQDAKDLLCQKIDNYIRDRIIIADQVIQDTASQKIKDGDTILTFARSSIVEKVILHAHEKGKRINVIVIDARPMLEGKRLLQTLTSHHIPCTYALLPSLPALLGSTSQNSTSSPADSSSSSPSLVVLGAHSIHANGSAYARAGSALVALMAKERGVPVLVCAETYKFSESVVLDGFGKNELAPAGLFQSTYPSSLTSPSSISSKVELQREPQQNLEILSPLYDLTPPANIAAVVTEVGIIPPNSISSILLTLGRNIV